MSKTLDLTTLTAEKLELATLKRVDDTTVITILDQEKVTELIKKHEEIEKEAEKAKQEAAGSSDKK